MVTIMWANEPFDPNKPDTHYLGINIMKKLKVMTVVGQDRDYKTSCY